MRRQSPHETDRLHRRKRVKLPSFCDYTSTVTADAFGASRLSELETLIRPHRPTTPTNLLAAFTSGGRKTSDRHLRRRSNNYKRRQRYREKFCLEGDYRPVEETASVIDGKKTEGDDLASGSIPPEHTSRKARRRKRHLLRMPHEGWATCLKYDDKDNDDVENNSVPAHSVHWMPTHVWHAKRFRMERLFGWMVPVIHNNRGTAAALRLAREKRCLVCDTTWSMQPVWFSLAGALNHCSNEGWSAQIRKLIPDFALSCQEPVLECGEGMLHCLDTFPFGAVSPVSWVVSRTCFQEGNDSETLPSLYVYLFAHPSCQQNLHKSLAKALQDIDCDGPYRGITGGLQYYELRGGESVYTTLSRCIPNTTVPSHGGLIHEQMIQLQSKPLVLIRCVSPRHSCGNEGVCGVDIIVGGTANNELFLSLVKEGGACAIGIAETAALRLACQPPLQVFPREYPDTFHGQLYWKGGNAKVGVEQDWACVRWYYEGGEGRIREYGHRSMKTVDYGILVKNETQIVGNPVVVRGQFLQPFKSAEEGILSCVSIPAGGGHRRRGRRKRRPASSERSIVNPRMDNDSNVEAHHAFCTTLLQQLSLPAILVAHIQVESNGVFKAGAPLYQVSNIERPMGFATSGAYCTIRGCYHGTVLVGASFLLEALASAIEDGAVAIVRSKDNVRKVHLRARIQGKVVLHNVILGFS